MQRGVHRSDATRAQRMKQRRHFVAAAARGGHAPCHRRQPVVRHSPAAGMRTRDRCAAKRRLRFRAACRRCVSRGGRRSRVRWGGFASSRAAAHGKSMRLSLLGKCKGECVVNRPARAGVAHAAPATSAQGPGSPPPTSAPGLDVRSGRVEHDSCQPGAERDRREDRPRDDAVSAQHLAHSHFAHSHFAHSHFAPFPLRPIPT